MRRDLGTPGVDFLDHVFYNLKNSSQDLSIDGSNFILSSLEVGHNPFILGRSPRYIVTTATVAKALLLVNPTELGIL